MTDEEFEHERLIAVLQSNNFLAKYFPKIWKQQQDYREEYKDKPSPACLALQAQLKEQLKTRTKFK